MEQLPQRLYIEEKVINHPYTRRILQRLGDVPLTVVEDYRKIGLEKDFRVRAEEDKNCLALAEKKGEVIKNVGRMEEDQFYLFHEIDCRYDCEYCYLQYYFNTKVPVVFVNRDEVLGRMENILQKSESPYFHVGEVCDSLAFDNITGFSGDVCELFSRYPNGTVEFRTKSTNVERLVTFQNPPSNVVPSWTFSPEYICETLEHRTPKLNERIAAAKSCQDAGYTVGVRLDPLFRYENWENDYRQMVITLLETLDPKKIDYITLGSIKLHKNLLDAVRKRFPDSPVILGEVVPSVDGKYRYIKFDRVDMYKKMVSWIREIDKDIHIELSLESEDIKELVFG